MTEKGGYNMFRDGGRCDWNHRICVGHDCRGCTVGMTEAFWKTVEDGVKKYKEENR